MNGTIDAMARAIIDKVYPVNVIVEFSLETDPNTAIGCGTQWERFAAGRALIGKSDKYAVGWEGGTETHTLTANQLPKITGGIAFQYSGGVASSVNGAHGVFSVNGETYAPSGFTETSNTRYRNVALNFGGGESHNNMQPSRAVDRWVRVA